MKALVIDGFYSWSIFSTDKQMDFNGHLWVRRPEGNILIDPVTMCHDDLEQLRALGGARWCVITNADHLRAARELREVLGFGVLCHPADAEALGLPIERTVSTGDEIVPGASVVHLPQGKTPGEIALVFPDFSTILFGDIIRGAPVGALNTLPDDKLANPKEALLALRRLLPMPIRNVLVGDGHSVFGGGRQALIDALAQTHAVDVYRINLDDLPWTLASQDPRYRHEIKDVSRSVGARGLAYNVRKVPAGSKSGPMHYHHNQEEFFFVLQGECHLERPGEIIPLRPGDFIAFPPGERGTHTLANHSQGPCEVLCVSNLPEHDAREVVGLLDFRGDLVAP